jgi:hypothetical protein
MTPAGASFDPVSDGDGPAFELPLFPLRSVLFPGGLLPLKIFEARYLDLITRCLRDGSGFGVVALREGAEAGSGRGPTLFERVGTMAELLEVDSPQGGILVVRSRGTQRFRIGRFERQADGLWTGSAVRLPEDPVVPPPAALRGVVDALRQAISSLAEQDAFPFLEPHAYEDAGWVANRWCELLPVPMAAKQRLMELADPVGRLSLVDDYLRGRGVVLDDG